MILLTGTGSNAEQNVVFTVTWPIPNAYFQCFFIISLLFWSRCIWRSSDEEQCQRNDERCATRQV